MKRYRNHLLFALGTYLLPVIYGILCPIALAEQEATGGALTLLPILTMLTELAFTIVLVILVILTCGRRAVPVRLALGNFGIVGSEIALLFCVPVLMEREPIIAMCAANLLTELLLGAVATLIFSIIYYFKHRGGVPDEF